MNWSYIAGLFDGEGNINRFTLYSSYKSKIYSYKGYKLRIIQSMRHNRSQVLEKIRDFMGYGKIYHHHHYVLILNITKIKDILDFIENVSSFAIIKKDELLVLRNEILIQSHLDVAKHSTIKVTV